MKIDKNSEEKAETDALIENLRVHGQLLETSDEKASIPPGVTHILLKKHGEEPKLIRKRTSLV